MSWIDEMCDFVLVCIVILIVSDMCGLDQDKFGDMLVQCLIDVGYILVDCKILLDECDQIVEQLCVWCVDLNVDVVILIGGIGLMG